MPDKKSIIGFGQFRWVVLSLIVAIVLPTICLLWFMGQAVKNERLVIRQKMLEFYTNDVKDYAKEELSNDWVSLNFISASAAGAVVYGPDGEITFPVSHVAENYSSKEIFNNASLAEHIENDLEGAIEEYKTISKNSYDKAIRITADMANPRCQQKIGQKTDAIETLKNIISTNSDNDLYVRVQKCRVNLMLLGMLRGSDSFDEQLYKTIDYATLGLHDDNGDFAWLGRPQRSNLYIPSGLQIFTLNKCIEYADGLYAGGEPERVIRNTKKLISYVEKSMELAEQFPKPTFRKNPGIVNSAVFTLDSSRKWYGQYKVFSKHTILQVCGLEEMQNIFAIYFAKIHQLPAECEVFDENGEPVWQIKSENHSEQFHQALGADYFPGWSVDVYLKDDSFQLAADKQIAIYTWTGILVAALIFMFGVIAVGSVRKQIKINRLKNDFIATVTHELKTPLASMRALTETLVEKTYADQQTHDEYLALITKENERLSRLIDNFLSFSRLERNKNAFDMTIVAPEIIAYESAEAVRAKFSNGDVKFTLDIAEHLPKVQADKDAMVTVLVNLIDNAYKYTEEDKQIGLQVFQKDNQVCFSVSDNGPGIPNRYHKKIFSRFYQIDSSLSRKVDGCGLGLSIVKFIVDSHGGSIELNCKAGKGCEFVVRLDKIEDGKDFNS